MIRQSLIVLFYWFSVAFIGFAILLWLRRARGRFTPLGRIASLALAQNSIIIFMTSFMAACFGSTIMSIFLYCLSLSTEAAVIVYLFALSMAVVYVCTECFKSAVSRKKESVFFDVSKRSLINQVAAYILALAIGLDLLVAYTTQSHSGGDAIFHMGRILSISREGFNLSNTFFSTVPESAYHINNIYTLFTVPVKLFSLQPIDVWRYSNAFFHLIHWGAIFTFSAFTSKYLINVRYNRFAWTSLMTLTGFLMTSGSLFIAAYPSQIVIAWIALLVIVMSRMIFRPVYLFIIGVPLSLSITMIHPIYSGATASLVILFTGLLIIRKGLTIRKNLRSLFVVGAIALTLLIGPLITFLMPNLSSSSQASLGEKNVIGSGFFTIVSPAILKPSSSPELIVFAVTFVASVYLLIKYWPRKVEWSLLFSLVSLQYLVLFFPPIFVLAHKVLPVWTLQRFSALNLVVYISGPVAMLAMVALFRSIVGYKQTIHKEVIEMGVAVFGALLLCVFLVIFIYPKSYQYAEVNTRTYQQNTVVGSDLSHVLNNNQLVIVDEAYGYMLTSVLNIDLVSVEQGHFPLAGDYPSRSECLKEILGQYGEANLKTVGAKYVVVPKAEMSTKKYNQAPDRNYLKLTAEDEYYLIYKFVPDNAQQTESGNKPSQSCERFRYREQHYK